jgi:RND superfamily putative drug exporter
MLSSIVTLPALLAVLGHRVDSRRTRRAAAAVAEETDGFWHGVATAVMRRPLPIALGVTALLILLGTPFLRLSVGLPDERVLPESSDARQVSERIQTGFQGDSAEAFSIVVERADDRAPLAAYATDVSMIDGVARVEGLDGIYQDGDVVGEASPSSARDGRDGAAVLECRVSISSPVPASSSSRTSAPSTPVSTHWSAAAPPSCSTPRTPSWPACRGRWPSSP